MLENVLQTAAIYCKIILISSGDKSMCDWNSSGQIDPTDQFIDYMAFREVMGCGIDDDEEDDD